MFTWLAYYPRTSPEVDTLPNGNQRRKAVSQTRSLSAVTPRKISYARGMRIGYTFTSNHVPLNNLLTGQKLKMENTAIFISVLRNRLAELRRIQPNARTSFVL